MFVCVYLLPVTNLKGSSDIRLLQTNNLIMVMFVEMCYASWKFRTLKANAFECNLHCEYEALNTLNGLFFMSTVSINKHPCLFLLRCAKRFGHFDLACDIESSSLNTLQLILRRIARNKNSRVFSYIRKPFSIRINKIQFIFFLSICCNWINCRIKLCIFFALLNLQISSAHNFSEITQ